MTLAEAIAAILISLPGVQTDHSLVIGESVASASGGNVRLAALMVSVGYHESRFLDRIQDARCLPRECDPATIGGKRVHQARSYWQLHMRAAGGHDAWLATSGLEPAKIQAASDAAARWLARGLRACRGSFAGSASYFYNGTCRGLPGAEKRARLAERVEARLRASVGDAGASRPRPSPASP